MKISVRTAALANLQHWRAGQGARIKAKRPLEVYRACEHLAQIAAPIRDPLELTQDELAIAVKRAITQERNRLHDPLIAVAADEWWTQIAAIAERCGIKTTRDDWTQKKPEDSSERKDAA